MLTHGIQTRAIGRLEFSSFVFALALSGFGCGSSAAPPDAGRIDASTDMAPVDAGPRPMAPVEGELNLLGCTPSASEIHVRLRPLAAPFVGSRTTAMPTPPTRTPLDAVVSATSDPHVFTYASEALTAADLYQVGVSVDDTTCGNLRWRGPRAGLVIPGGAPARFDGAVTSSRLEMRATRADGEHWVSRDFVRSDATARRFRWSTELPGVTAFELQFATERFAVDQLSPELSCAPPQGLLHTARVAHSAIAPNEAEIDLTPVLAEPPADAGALARARWEQIRFRRAPIYVRAVPITGADKLCDPLIYGLGSWVELVVSVPEENPPMIGGPPTRLTGTFHHGEGPWVEPQLGAICYTVVTPNTLPYLSYDELHTHDVLSWNLVVTGFHPPGYTMLPGESFCWWPPAAGDSSFLDDVVSGFSDAITGLVDAVSQAVNAIAALYEAIKSIAVDIVTYALSEITGCPAWCHSLVQMAAEYALVAMGLPPTLPNFDQLVDQGIGYLAEEIAAQTGVPSEVTVAAIDIATDMVERAKATRGGSSGSWSWAVEDTGFRPSTLILDVTRGSALGTPTPGLFVHGSGHWLPTTADLFTPAPGEAAIRMPLVLNPDFEGIAAPAPIIPEFPPYLPAYYGHPERVQSSYQASWFVSLVSNSCVALRAEAIDYGFLGIPIFIQPYADVTIFNTPGSFSDPFHHACTP